MPLPPFDFHEPATLALACELMAKHQDTARVLAGGTDLIVRMKKKMDNPATLVSLLEIPELAELHLDDKTLDIGACVTITDLAESSLVKQHFPALASAALCLGSILVRNRATIGGNISSARPAADLLPSLMVHKADLVLKSSQGQRTCLLQDYILNPGVTARKPDEILTRIRIPLPPPASGGGYLQIGKRKALEINLINVASFLQLDPVTNNILKARIVLGSVGPTPLRTPSAEAFIMGKSPDENLFYGAGEAARKDVRPIDDFRGSADYRRAMAGILTKRTLELAAAQAQQQ